MMARTGAAGHGAGIAQDDTPVMEAAGDGAVPGRPAGIFGVVITRRIDAVRCFWTARRIEV